MIAYLPTANCALASEWTCDHHCLHSTRLFVLCSCKSAHERIKNCVEHSFACRALHRRYTHRFASVANLVKRLFICTWALLRYGDKIHYANSTLEVHFGVVYICFVHYWNRNSLMYANFVGLAWRWVGTSTHRMVAMNSGHALEFGIILLRNAPQYTFIAFCMCVSLFGLDRGRFSHCN